MLGEEAWKRRVVVGLEKREEMVGRAEVESRLKSVRDADILRGGKEREEKKKEEERIGKEMGQEVEAIYKLGHTHFK